jgi:hypothetical protein
MTQSQPLNQKITSFLPLTAYLEALILSAGSIQENTFTGFRVPLLVAVYPFLDDLYNHKALFFSAVKKWCQQFAHEKITLKVQEHDLIAILWSIYGIYSLLALSTKV